MNAHTGTTNIHMCQKFYYKTYERLILDLMYNITHFTCYQCIDVSWGWSMSVSAFEGVWPTFIVLISLPKILLQDHKKMCLSKNVLNYSKGPNNNTQWYSCGTSFQTSEIKTMKHLLLMSSSLQHYTKTSSALKITKCLFASLPPS